MNESAINALSTLLPLRCSFRVMLLVVSFAWIDVCTECEVTVC